jgi:hypothetical protein
LANFLSFRKNLKIELAAPECATKLTYWGKIYVKLFIPVLFAAAFWIVSGLEDCVKIKNARISQRSSLKKRKYTYVAFFGLNLFTLIFGSVLSPFRCIRQGNTYFIIDYTEVECYSQEWYRNLPLIILFMILYCVCFPLWIGHILFVSGRGERRDTLSFTSQFGILTRPYRREVYYWELVYLLRRAVLVASTSFWKSAAASYQLKLLSTAFLLLFFLLLELFVSPYASGVRVPSAT